MTFCSVWNYIDTSTTLATSLTANSDNCLNIDYIYMGTTRNYCVFCPFNKAATDTDDANTKMKINAANVPYINGKNLPTGSSFSWSNNDGNVISLKVTDMAMPSSTPGSITFNKNPGQGFKPENIGEGVE